MEGIVRAATEEPFLAIGVCLVALLLLYFFFKRLIKFLLIVVLIAILIGGYFYFEHPESRPATLKDAVESARNEAARALDQGQEAYRKGKELVGKGNGLFDKGKELIEQAKAFLDKGIDQGKEDVKREKGNAGPVKKPLEKNPKTGDGRRL